MHSFPFAILLFIALAGRGTLSSLSYHFLTTIIISSIGFRSRIGWDHWELVSFTDPSVHRSIIDRSMLPPLEITIFQNLTLVSVSITMCTRKHSHHSPYPASISPPGLCTYHLVGMLRRPMLLQLFNSGQRCRMRTMHV